MVAQGVFHHVPVIIGDVSDEGRMFVYPDFPTPPPDQICEEWIQRIFGADARKVCMQACGSASGMWQVLEEFPIPTHNSSFDCRPNVDLIDRYVRWRDLEVRSPAHQHLSVHVRQSRHVTSHG
jgi:hypothetical protein